MQNFDWCKQLCISFYKVHGFIRAYDRIRCLILFYFKKHEVFSRMRYLIGVKSGITMFFLTIMQRSKMIHMIFCHWKKC